MARLPQWLRARAATLELELDDDAVQFIVDRTEGNLLAAQQELEKLSCWRRTEGGSRRRAGLASATARASTCSSSVRPRSAGDVPRALRILAGLRSEGVEPTLVTVVARARGPQHLGHHAERRRRCAQLAAAFGRAGHREAPRRASLPYARLAARIARADRMIKGQHRGDAWDEMALLHRRIRAVAVALPLTGNRAA